MVKIRFSIPLLGNVHDGSVQLIVHDILGRKVTTLVNETLQPGTYEVEFDGSNYSSGVYYYMIDAGDFKKTKKMILLK